MMTWITSVTLLAQEIRGAHEKEFLEKKGPRYLPLQDDIVSTVYWYQMEPHGKYPTLPGVNDLDVN